MKVVVVGGVAGGASAAARIRRLDASAQIVMLEKGEHVSFELLSPVPFERNGRKKQFTGADDTGALSEAT